VSDPLAPIANKIRPLIRLLSSDQSGEVVAAARALSRLVKTNGADMHILADSIAQINGGLSEKEMRKLYDAGFEAGVRSVEGRHPSAAFRDVDGDDELTPGEMIMQCMDHLNRLRNEREREFIQGLARHSGPRRLSDKQKSWLRDCYARVRR
jgi:hypothetical protein